MNIKIPEDKKISPYLVFYLIASMQFGIGVLGFQRTIAKTAGYDAWMAIPITGISIHIILWMMLKMLKTVDGDLISIHIFVFGKKIGKYINIVFIFYFCLLATTVLRNYIEVVQVWMFPELSTFVFATAFLILVIYTVYGGLRTVTGMALFSIIIPCYILLVFFFNIPFADFTNLLPILNHSGKEILLASHNMSLTVIGFETILFFYPFIKNKEKSGKWAYLANIVTTCIYTYIAVITFAYFSKLQLKKNIWPTLTMWKIVELPFIERFEYIGITNWFLIILPNICIPLWCASRVAKRLFPVRQKVFVLILASLCLVVASFITSREQINFLAEITAKAGFYLNFVYIPILFILLVIVKKVKKIE